MNFRLIIDKEKDEEVVATVHSRTALIDELEALVSKYAGSDRIPGYTEDNIKMLSVDEIECITVFDSKTRYARVEVKFATALDNLSAHVGNNSRQSVRADMWVCLVENLLCSTVIYKTLQCSVVVAALL